MPLPALSQKPPAKRRRSQAAEKVVLRQDLGALPAVQHRSRRALSTRSDWRGQGSYGIAQGCTPKAGRGGSRRSRAEACADENRGARCDAPALGGCVLWRVCLFPHLRRAVGFYADRYGSRVHHERAYVFLWCGRVHSCGGDGQETWQGDMSGFARPGNISRRCF